MNWRRVVGSLSYLPFLIPSMAESAEEKRAVIRLVPVAPRALYRPGDSITLELRCPTLKTEVLVMFNPGEGSEEGGIENPMQRCPYSRFELKIPRDFIGTGNVAVLIRHDGQLQGDMWDFEVRSDRRPRELWMWDLSSSREAPFGYDKCPTFYYAPGRPPQSLNIYAIMQDGVRLDLCGEGVATVRTDPPRDFPFAIQNGSCTVTPRRAGSFRVTARYNGLTKSWVCGVEEDELVSKRSQPSRSVEQASPPPSRAPAEEDTATLPRVLPNPGAAMTAGEFLANPMRLRSHPTDVGDCRLLEHWTSGYCYVYSKRGGGKVSEKTDARCGEMAELRRRMKTAIEGGHCGDIGSRGRSPGADTRGTTPQSPTASSLAQNRAHFRNTMSDMRALATAVEAYAVEYEGYPVVGDLRTLTNLVEPRFLPQGKAPRIDAWGTPYVFLCDGRSYRVVSAGADRTFEPNSAKLDGATAGRTNDAARDLIYSNGHFVQWPE